MKICTKKEKIRKMFFICKKQNKFILFLSVFTLLKSVPCVAAISSCEASLIEEEWDNDENRFLDLAERAEQLMENAREMLDKIKNIEEHKSLFFEENVENNSSTSSEPLSLEEIHNAKKFFSGAQQKFQRMANTFLNQATGTGHPGLQNLENEFHNLEKVFNKQASYLERQINDLLSGAVNFQNGISNSAESQLFLEALMENPHLLQANTPYFVEFSNNQTSAFVIFDDSVVDLFLSPKVRAFHFDLLKKNISSIRKGFTSGFGVTGLKILGRTSGNKGKENKHKDVFEVKTIGRVAGNVRLGGFKDDQGNLYIVHYKKGSEHEVGKMNSFVETIVSKRDSAKKTSHFNK